MITVPTTKEISSLEELVRTLNTKIEANQNTITVQESNVIRLKNAIQAENYTINEQSKEKEELTNQIKGLAEEKNARLNDISELDTLIQTAKLDLSNIKRDIVKFSTERDEQSAILAKKEQEIKKKEAELIEKEKENGIRLNELVEKENKLIDKSNLIKELAIKLK